MIVTFTDRSSRSRHLLTVQLWDEFDRYVTLGVHPSNFVFMVLQNDLVYSARAADTVNLLLLGQIATFVEREIPVHMRGSREAIMAWTSHQGIEGLPEGEQGMWYANEHERKFWAEQNAQDRVYSEAKA